MGVSGGGRGLRTQLGEQLEFMASGGNEGRGSMVNTASFKEKLHLEDACGVDDGAQAI